MFLAKKVGDFIEKESESLEFIGLEIPRDYYNVLGGFYIDYNIMPPYLSVHKVDNFEYIFLCTFHNINLII